jgi:hypothetical protein
VQNLPTPRPVEEFGDDNDIVQVVEVGTPPRHDSKVKRNSYAGHPHQRHSPAIHNKARRSGGNLADSSDDEESSRFSRFSRNSAEYSPITTPTSGGSPLPRSLGRSKSNRQRRDNGIDYMSSVRDDILRKRSRSRGGGHRSYSEDHLDDLDIIRDRDLRDSRALYKPERRLTRDEILDLELLRRLERSHLDEGAKLDQRRRERDSYDERNSRRYGDRSSRAYERSPSRRGYEGRRRRTPSPAPLDRRYSDDRWRR